MDEARAFWITSPGRGEIRGQRLRSPAAGELLIRARALQEELHEQASEHLSLPPGRGSVLSYYLRDENGTVRFSDNSPGQPKVFRELALLVLQVAQQVCHLPQQGA